MFSWPNQETSQEPRKVRRNHEEHAEEIRLWSIARDLKEAFRGQQLSSYHDQEIGYALREAFNAGRDLEKRLTQERDSKLAGVGLAWPFI